MTRLPKKLSSKCTNPADGETAVALPDLWRPTSHQQYIKAKFWEMVGDNPLIDPANVELTQVAELTQCPQIVNWVKNPNFKVWFQNKDEYRYMLKSGVESAVQRLLSIVRETDVGRDGKVTAATQLQACKLLLDYAGYAPATKKEVTYKDDFVDSMDEAALKSYIQKQLGDGAPSNDER